MSPRAAAAGASTRSTSRSAARSTNSRPAKAPARASSKAASKAPAKAPARASSTAPKSSRAAKPTAARTAAKTSTKTSTKTTVKPVAKTAAKTSGEAPARAAVKTPGRRAAPKQTRSAPKARTRTAGHRKISAGEVEYSAAVFRSRLEMRWCAFFDLLGVDYDYEPCWYRVGESLRYLPDIYLPGLGLWAEVKGPDFMDAASWAKIAAAVAGPAPLPAREHPYAPAERMLLLGPMDRDVTTDPAIGLVQRTGNGTAGIFRARIQGAGLQTRFVPDLDPLETVTATGVAAARRPVEKIRTRVLLPTSYSEATEVGESSRLAYRAAARLRVDDTRRALAHDNDRDVIEALERRRGGRPLPRSPWPGT